MKMKMLRKFIRFLILPIIQEEIENYKEEVRSELLQKESERLAAALAIYHIASGKHPV